MKFRVVDVKRNDHDTLWYFHEVGTRCGHFLKQPQHDFHIIAYLLMPQCVVAVSLMPQHVVVVFSAHSAFSIFERNTYTNHFVNTYVGTAILFCLLQLLLPHFLPQKA